MAIKEREEQRWRSERERSNDVQREREEEQMLGICRERERGRTDRGQEERGFFFMNKQHIREEKLL